MSTRTRSSPSAGTRSESVTLTLAALGLLLAAALLPRAAAAADAAPAARAATAATPPAKPAAPDVTLPFVLPVAGMRAVELDRYRVSGLTMTVENGGWPSLSMLGHPFATIGALSHGGDCPYDGTGPVPVSFGALRMGDGGRFADQEVNAVSNRLTYRNDRNQALSVRVSRLTPALLVSAESGALELFAAAPGAAEAQAKRNIAVWDAPHQKMVPLDAALRGPFAPGSFPPPAGLVKPLRWAVPRADGSVLTGVMGEQPHLTFPFIDWHVRFAPTPSLAPASYTMPPVDGLGQHWLLLWYGSGSPLLSSKVPVVLTGGAHFGVQIPEKLSSVFHADVPLLLVFSESPTAIALRPGTDGGQFVITFASPTATTALLPLYGHDIQAAAITEQWLATFPSAVRDRCDAWAKRLGAYPLDVQEASSYDAQADRITISERVSFADLRPGSAHSALMRPMLALALTQKVGGILAPAFEDLGYPTQFGPLVALPDDHYQWSVDGVGRYVEGQETVGPGTAQSAELEHELSAEVDAVLAAGHLAPWVTGVGGLFSDDYGVYGKSPAETLYFLAEVLPVLPEAQQAKVIAYLTAEATAFPPDTTQQLAVETGARREFFQMPSSAYFLKNFDWLLGRNTRTDEYYEPAPSLFRAYAIARYDRLAHIRPDKAALAVWHGTLQQTLADREWDTLGWYWGSHAVNGGEQKHIASTKWPEYARHSYMQFTLRAVHRDLAGLIGYLRLCQAGGEPADPEAWGQVARLLVLRCSLARYGGYLLGSGLFRMPGTPAAAPYSCEAQLVASPDRMSSDPSLSKYLARSADYSMPENHFEQVGELDQHEVAMFYGADNMQTGWYFGFNNPYYGTALSMGYQNTFLDLVPEVGHLLADHGLGADAAGYLRHYAVIQPVWYKAHAENLQYCTGEAAGIMANDAYQLFMAHAWIAGTPPATLERYIDVPWAAVGDFFYLHKLSEAIKAYRGVTWARAQP